MMTKLPGLFLTRPLAHRGLHDPGRPENSLPAFDAAAQAGYGIELDVQLSADDQAVVFHDDTLDRMTGTQGPVRGQSAQALSHLFLAGTQTGIPSLARVLDSVPADTPVLIELKDQHSQLGPTNGALENAVARTLEGRTGTYAVMSFNPHMVETLQSLAPQTPRGLTTCAFLPAEWTLPPDTRDSLHAIDAFHACGASFVSHDARDLMSARIAALRNSGVPILAWTIRSGEEERRARKVAANVTFEGYKPVIPT